MTSTGSNSFRPGKALTLQVAVALVTVLSLATWQVSRGLEKTALTDAYRERLGAAPVDTSVYTESTPDFTRLSLMGRYDPGRSFLVSSFPAAARGFEVVSVFVTREGPFLVNRGWQTGTPADADVETPTGHATLVGVVWPTTPLSPGIRRETWSGEWPKTIRAIDPSRMAEATGAAPREIRLEAGGPGVLRAASLAWSYAPGQHWSYAVQWLLIGAAVGIGYVVIGRRRGRRADAGG